MPPIPYPIPHVPLLSTRALPPVPPFHVPTITPQWVLQSPTLPLQFPPEESWLLSHIFLQGRNLCLFLLCYRTRLQLFNKQWWFRLRNLQYKHHNRFPGKKSMKAGIAQRLKLLVVRWTWWNNYLQRGNRKCAQENQWWLVICGEVLWHIPRLAS